MTVRPIFMRQKAGVLLCTGLVFDIDHFAVHDGNGIRTTVFLKGCPLQCIWCHSPESQSSEAQILFIRSKCTSCGACESACKNGSQSITHDGNRVYNRIACTGCGDCVNDCPNDALVYCGRKMSSEEVIAEAAQDMVFFRNSGGGVTLTGGEVLYQPVFALEILKGLKQLNIHTIIETSGMGSWSYLEQMIPYTDQFYYDVKTIDSDKHIKFTGVSNKTILDNLEMLTHNTKNITIRVPLIPGYNDRCVDVCSIYKHAAELSLINIHLIPYNASAGAKYEWLGREYQPGNQERQSPEYLQSLKNLAPAELNVEIMY